MSSLLPPPTSDSHFFVSGDVSIHPAAAIAPGVLLQADPGARIIIAAGACIGMGSVLHASQGAIEVAQGAILGTQVLVLGSSVIGAGACIGAGVTIFDRSIRVGEVIPPQTLIGDLQAASKSHSEPPPASAPPAVEPKTPPATEPPSAVNNGSQPQVVETTTSQSVCGQASLNRLMGMLFPYRQSLNASSDDATSDRNGNSH